MKILILLTLLFATTLQAQEYNGEVSRIIGENCVVCHRQGGIAPMQFETYEQVRPWAPLIAHKVEIREMPPYAYDTGIGIQDLIGDWRLSDGEISTLVDWAESGAPQGDIDVLPFKPKLPSLDEWNFAPEFGEPDLIVPSQPYDIPSNGNDLWSKEFVDLALTESRCIKAVQVKPRGDAKSVVHHANSDLYMVEDGELKHYGQLTEYAMGKWGELIPNDVCRLLPAEALIRWDIHMYPGGVGSGATGSTITDNVVEIGIWFHPPGYETEVYRQDLRLYVLRSGYENGHLIVPPHGYAMTQGFHSFDHPVRIDSFQPHGHLRMNAASLEIFNPSTGRTRAVSQISNWSATWHHSHIYEPSRAPRLEPGEVLVIKQWYDNTKNNHNNPDPDQWVYDGSRTGDEMSHAWIAVTHLVE